MQQQMMLDQTSIETGENEHENNVILDKMHRRRNFQRHACIISVMVAFVIGLSLGVFVIGLGTAISTEFNDRQLLSSRSLSILDTTNPNSNSNGNNENDGDGDDDNDFIDYGGGGGGGGGGRSGVGNGGARDSDENNNNNNYVIADELNTVDKSNHANLRFPTIYDIQNADRKHRDSASYAVTFVTEEKGQHKHVSTKNDIGAMRMDELIVESNDRSPSANGRTRKNRTEQTADGKHVHALKSTMPTNSFKRLNKSNSKKYAHISYANNLNGNMDDVAVKDTIYKNIDTSSGADDASPFDMDIAANEHLADVIDDNIYWGRTIEAALPNGFSTDHVDNWTTYVDRNAIVKLEIGCGRMQNRLITFQDGRKACARYRQNTDQIQGELFSFYLGRLLNLTNLAPSTASIIDLNAKPWISAAQDIQAAQWKPQRAVVLTDWIPNLEAANIPLLFQPIERHLNKFDVRNITLGLDVKPTKSLLSALNGIKANPNWNQLPVMQSDGELNRTVQQKLIELAQWSDLIVFDYLIANLDRVVNNLYNFQWNADIMTAPAHNLARQSATQLLVFLDNESGLLHGYRLLKKYEIYHGLLLENLCVFRRPTIDALQRLRADGVGKRLQQLFAQSTTDKVRDILPSLPDKSIKILVERIDRVLGQVQKCRGLFSHR